MSTPDTPDSGTAPLEVRRRARPWLARVLLRWHRHAGAFAALFLLFIAVSGTLLMHSDRLGLPTAQIANPWVLRWYGIRPPPPPRGFQSNGHWFSQLGNHLYFDTAEIPFGEGELAGVFATGAEAGADEWLVVTDTQAMVLDAAGAVQERFGRDAGLPPGLTAAGRDTAGDIIVAANQGRFRFDADSGEFVVTDSDAAVHWSSAGTPPPALTTAISRAYGGEGISIERFILDLHSGRLFGTLGVVLVNLASLLLLYLAGSGLYLWSRRVAAARRRG